MILDKLNSMTNWERVELPGQVKVKIVSFITGRPPCIIFPWEDPLDAAESLAPEFKIKNAEQNKAEAEQWLTEWFDKETNE